MHVYENCDIYKNFQFIDKLNNTSDYNNNVIIQFKMGYR